MQVKVVYTICQVNVGGKLKAATNWKEPNLGADNSSGFTAYGSGYRRPPGEIVYFREWTGYLTTSPATGQGNYRIVTRGHYPCPDYRGF